jgi:hypothetical protein
MLAMRPLRGRHARRVERLAECPLVHGYATSAVPAVPQSHAPGRAATPLA